MTHKTNSQQLYNQFAPYYRSFSHDRQEYLSAIDCLIVDHARFLKEKPSMVDVGCADGARAAFLAKKLRASPVLMIDNSETMCTLAKQQMSFLVKQEDITTSSFSVPKDPYTITLCLWNVLGHVATLSQRQQAFRNLADLTANNGRVYLDVNNRFNLKQYGWKVIIRNLWSEIFSYKKREGVVACKVVVHSTVVLDSLCHFFAPWEVHHLAQQAGMVVERLQYVDYRTGQTQRYFWQGQIFVVLRKATV